MFDYVGCGQELKLLGGTELEGSSALASLREKLGLGGDAEWEDELIGEWDEEAAAAKAAAAEEEGIEEEGDEEAEASKAAVLKALEEYYKLDYEQDIGGLKCRFNYRCTTAPSPLSLNLQHFTLDSS
jgi:hypothetical protein